jgi:hypothetical protein
VFFAFTFIELNVGGSILAAVGLLLFRIFVLSKMRH